MSSDDKFEVGASYISDDIRKELLWLRDVHKHYPPRYQKESISLFYSKMNDRFDGMVSRVHDKERRWGGALLDIVKFFGKFVLWLFERILGANIKKTHNKIGLKDNGNHVVIDYQGALDKPIGVPGIWNDRHEELRIVIDNNDPDGLYLKIISNYSFTDVVRFTLLLLSLARGIPVVKGNIWESFVQISREMSHTYLFEFYLLANALRGHSGEIVMLYEDQPRDRLLIHFLQDEYLITGYVHSPAFHWHRYNMIYTESDLLKPAHYLFESPQKRRYFEKFKNISLGEKALSCELPMEDLTGFHYDNIIVYLPNVGKVVTEIEHLFLSEKRFIADVSLVPHPNMIKKGKRKVWHVAVDPEVDPEKSLIISSFMTNKGFQMAQEGFHVCYLGSSEVPWYNPFPDDVLPFVSDPMELFEFLHEKDCMPVERV